MPSSLRNSRLRVRALQRLLARFAEFVDEDPAEASARGGVVAARAREGEQDFAGEARSSEYGRMA
jgi:hypothetical protein